MEIQKVSGVYATKIVLELTTGSVGQGIKNEKDAKKSAMDLLRKCLKETPIGTEEEAGLFQVKVISIESENIKREKKPEKKKPNRNFEALNKKDKTKTLLIEDLKARMTEEYDRKDPGLSGFIETVISFAQKGYYHDLDSHFPTPKHALHTHLECLGFDDLAQEVLNGRYG